VNWPLLANLAIAAGLAAVAACAIWQALRGANQRVDAILTDLDNQNRKEDR